MKNQANEIQEERMQETTKASAESISGESACACTPPAPADGEKRSCGCCSSRTKQRSGVEYRNLVNRLNRIEGQVRGIRGMVERGAYCPDILIQASAVTAAVNAFNKALLASHIRTCVAHDIREGDDSVVDELVSVLQKLMK